jgi:hypothetical protein
VRGYIAGGGRPDGRGSWGRVASARRGPVDRIRRMEGGDGEGLGSATVSPEEVRMG